MIRQVFSLPEDEAGGVLAKVGRAAVGGQGPLQFPQQAGPDGLTLRPVKLGHPLDHLGQLTGHEADPVAYLYSVADKFLAKSL